MLGPTDAKQTVEGRNTQKYKTYKNHCIILNPTKAKQTLNQINPKRWSAIIESDRNIWANTFTHCDTRKHRLNRYAFWGKYRHNSCIRGAIAQLKTNTPELTNTTLLDMLKSVGKRHFHNEWERPSKRRQQHVFRHTGYNRQHRHLFFCNAQDKRKQK